MDTPEPAHLASSTAAPASTRDGEADAYALGTDSAERDRLREQHAAWIARTRAFWERGGLRAGERVLDLGCGPGGCSLELARWVGPAGRVLAVDRSARFLDELRAAAERERLAWLAPLQADAAALALPPASLDLAYARWVLAWLTDPDPALAAVAAALAPGGRVLLHEYLHWGTLALLPRAPAVGHAVRACLADWAAAGLHVDLAAELPERAPRSGLALVELRPVARAGRPGSPVWTWVAGFLRGYLPRLAERRALDAGTCGAALAELDAAERDPRALIVAPLMAEALLVPARG